jgi:hypothetical protein
MNIFVLGDNVTDSVRAIEQQTPGNRKRKPTHDPQ